MATHKPLPVDHYIAHVRGFAGIDDLRVRVVRVALEARGTVHRARVHQDQVGAFTGFQ